MHVLKRYLPALGRVLLSSIFIYDGMLQLLNPRGTAGYFAQVNVPTADMAVWISVVIHLIGGLAILVGFKIRWAAAVLALFCLGTAVGVHLPAGETTHLLKNVAMAGGFLYVVAFGAGAFSVDGPG